MEAQLNCRADNLATSQQNLQQPEDLVTVPSMPGVSTQLMIGNKTITTKHIAAIRRFITSINVMKYVTCQEKWSQGTAEKVDWKLHERVNNKHQSVAYTKYLH